MKRFLSILILSLVVVAGCSPTSPNNTTNRGGSPHYPDHTSAGASSLHTASGNTPSLPALSNQPPDAVISSFKQRYPDLTANDWTIREGKCCTTYMRDGISYNAFFTQSGEWIGSETNVTLSDLPVIVKKAYGNGMYGTAANPQILRIEKSKYPILYKIEGQLNNQPFVQYFTPEGQEVSLSEK